MSMDLNTLQSFCDETRAKTATPFSVGEYTLATDGYILVRVPRLAEVPEREDAPKIEMLATDRVCGPFFREPAQWVPIPKVELQYRPCDICGGTGRLFKCPECNGHGEVEWDSDYCSYEATCKMCDGAGTTEVGTLNRWKVNPNIRKLTEIGCHACESGKGRLIDGDLHIGEARFSIVLLHRLRALTSVEIGVLTPHMAARVRFDGGDGLIMPMRPST